MLRSKLTKPAMFSATVAAAILHFSPSAALAAPPAKWQVMEKVELGGEGGWDFLTIDAKSRRLYLPRSTRVMVVDVDTKAVVGEVKDTPGVHGVAVVPKLNRGFTANGKGSSVTVFDLKTFAAIASVPAGTNPDFTVWL